VKEKRKGPIGRAAAVAEGLAATVRRMQREREPRVLVYDETGYARLVQPDGRGYERLLETAERMVALVDEAGAETKPRRAKAAAKPPRADGAGKEDAAPRSGRAKPRQTKAAGQAKPRRARRTETQGTGAAKPRPARRTKADPEAKRGRARSSEAARKSGSSAKQRRRPRGGPGKDDA
jgi:hypothetical protein